MIKAAELFQEEKQRREHLVATLVLTTNQPPSQDLYRDTHAFGASQGLAIDIWSVSRLADFLDNDPSGQWLRQQYFGIDQQRLSRELLAELSRNSLEHGRPKGEPSTLVARDLDRAIGRSLQTNFLFVIAESGLGKSVACFKRPNEHVASGGFGLILPHYIVATSLSIREAIGAALRQLHPQLAFGAEIDALAFCSSERPLLLVVKRLRGQRMTASQNAMIDVVPVPVADVRVETIEGELLLYHPQQTKAIYLNPSAAVIWSLCDGRRRIGEIIALIAASYPEPKDHLTEEVFASVAQLRDSGVLSAKPG